MFDHFTFGCFVHAHTFPWTYHSIKKIEKDTILMLLIDWLSCQVQYCSACQVESSLPAAQSQQFHSHRKDNNVD